MARHTLYRVLIAAVCSALGIGRAWGQGPTIDTGSPNAPPGDSTLLGRMPGGGDSLLGSSPGSGGQVLGPVDTQGFLGGRPGTSTPRVPTAISTPGGAGVAPIAGGAISLPTPLQTPEVPVYGTLDFPTIAEDEGPAGALSLDQAIEVLVRSNLDLRASFYELPQADADVLTASLRANPILYADAQLIPYGAYSNQRPGGPIQYDLNISYPFDVNHKRQARIASARRARRVLEAQYQDAVRLQIGNLYTAFVTVLAARQAKNYARAGVEGLDVILGPLESKVEQGAITKAAYNRIKLQRETAQIALIDAEEAHRRAKRDLATLLNVPADQSESLDVRGKLRQDAPAPPAGDALIRLALDRRPDLVAFRLGIGKAVADVELARRNRLNDIYVLYQPYTFQDNTPFGTKSATSWALGVTVPLPIYNRNQGVIRRAELNVAQTQTELSAQERRVVNEVQQAEREYYMSQEAVRRVETILQPAAVQVLTTVRREYEISTIDIITFQTARQEYNQVVKQYLDALVRHRRSMLDLNTAVGQRIMP
jgi:cobalt-zinc-cadmium efflux system outer membrane protein